MQFVGWLLLSQPHIWGHFWILGVGESWRSIHSMSNHWMGEQQSFWQKSTILHQPYTNTKQTLTNANKQQWMRCMSDTKPTALYKLHSCKHPWCTYLCRWQSHSCSTSKPPPRWRPWRGWHNTFEVSCACLNVAIQKKVLLPAGLTVAVHGHLVALHGRFCSVLIVLVCCRSWLCVVWQLFTGIALQATGTVHPSLFVHCVASRWMTEGIAICISMWLKFVAYFICALFILVLLFHI